MAATRLQTTATHLTGLNGVMESGSTLPTSLTAGPAGLHGTGQQFLNTTNDAVHIHTGSSQWRKMELTTTSTTTS